MASYTDDPVLLQFARQFCDELPRGTPPRSSKKTSIAAAQLVLGGGGVGVGASARKPLGGAPSCTLERWCARVLRESAPRHTHRYTIEDSAVWCLGERVSRLSVYVALESVRMERVLESRP